MSLVLAGLVELMRVVRAVPGVERRRYSEGPLLAVRFARSHGACRLRRTLAERTRLKRAVSLVDRFLGGNCYRRVLLEASLDAGAAAEPIHFGLKAGGGARSGHAWIGHERENEGRYDFVFSL